MTPSTPPRSRSTVLLSQQLQSRQKLDRDNNNNNNSNVNSSLNDNIDDNNDFFLSNISKKLQAPPETPKKNTGLDIPMTPSTILHRHNTSNANRVLFKYDKNNSSCNNNNNILLAPPLPKFNGLRSPEFSPMRRLSIIPSDNDKNNNNNTSTSTTTTTTITTTTEGEDIKINKINVSRVLFPISLSSDDDDNGTDDDDDNINVELFAPSTPPNKMAKNCPGTPSHQIITSKQAKDWNNESYPLYNKEHGEAGNRNSDYSNDDDDSDFICEIKLENPFMTSFSSSSASSPAVSRPLTREERLERHQQLIKENPDIENVITYVNKRGEITKRRVLTSKEKKRFKPRALIFKDDSSSSSNE